MTRVMLGLRLAARAGRARMFAVVGCSALGLLLLLLCIDFPDVAHNPGQFVSHDDRITYRVLTSVVALPIIVLIATMSRLSSDTRDRRLSTLRLMGLPPRGAGMVAAAETGALVLVGAALGVLLHAMLRGMIWRASIHHGLGHQVPAADWVRSMVVAVITAVIVAAVAAGPARRSGTLLMQTARHVRRGRFTRIFAVIGAAGFTIAAILAFMPSHQGQVATNRLIAMAAALICLAIGILSFASLTCAWLARRLRRSSNPSMIVAAARTESDRTALGRAFAGLGAATFVAAFGLSVFTIFTTTPQYKSAAYGHHHETAFVLEPLSTEDGATPAKRTAGAKELATSKDVIQATPAAILTSSGVGKYARIVSLTCAQIRTQASLTQCSDQAPWVAKVDAASDGSQEAADGSAAENTQPGLTFQGDTMTYNKHHVPVKPAFTTSVALNDATPNATIRSILTGSTLVLPPAVMARNGLAVDSLFVRQRPGGTLTDNYALLSAYRIDGFVDSETWNLIEGYRHLTYLLIGVVMSVGLLTVIVSVLDLLAERRRRVASLRMMGIPAATLRRAQFLSTLVPMAATLTLTLVAGYLMGRAYLNFAGEAGSTPTTQLAELLGIMLIFGVALAAATTSGLGRPLTANLIRRE